MNAPPPRMILRSFRTPLIYSTAHTRNNTIKDRNPRAFRASNLQSQLKRSCKIKKIKYKTRFYYLCVMKNAVFISFLPPPTSVVRREIPRSRTVMTVHSNNNNFRRNNARFTPELVKVFFFSRGGLSSGLNNRRNLPQAPIYTPSPAPRRTLKERFFKYFLQRLSVKY